MRCIDDLFYSPQFVLKSNALIYYLPKRVIQKLVCLVLKYFTELYIFIEYSVLWEKTCQGHDLMIPQRIMEFFPI